MSRLTTESLAHPEALLVRPTVHRDERGSFCETYNARDFASLGINETFVQDNVAVSTRAGALRGLHYQLPPSAQAKLVRVARGAIFDVCVDMRRSSPRFGEWASVRLSGCSDTQLYVPAGFAHGYLTLEDNTEVVYKVSNYYDPTQECGVRWDDVGLAIAWPLHGASPLLSAKDAQLPDFANARTFP